MPTVNGPDEITDLEAGIDKVFFSDSNGDVKEVSLGATGTVLTSTGLTADPAFSAIPADPTVGANKAMYTNNSDVESGVAFGAAGTVLTSGGTDATANPPTWAVPTGGQEIAMTADGAVAAGKIVAWKAGKAVQIATSTATQSNGGANSGVSSEAYAALNGFDQSFDPDHNQGFYAMNRVQSTAYYQLHQNVIAYSGTAASSPAVAPLTSVLADIDGNQSYGTYYAGVSCAYDTANDQPIVVYRNLSNQIEFRGLYYNAATTYYPLSYSTVVYSGAAGSCTAMCWNPATSQVIIVFTISSDMYIQVGDASGGVPITWGSSVQADAGVNPNDKFDMTWNADENVAVLVYDNAGSGTKARAFSLTGTGASSAVVAGTAVSFGGGEFPDKKPVAVYDPEAARTYFVANRGSGNYYISGHLVSSGTTLTASTVKSFAGDTSMGTNGQFLGPARGVSGTGLHGAIIAFSNYGASQYMYMGTVEYRAATDDVFWKEAPILFSSTVTYGPMATYDPVKGFGCTYWINHGGGKDTICCYYIPNKSSETGSNILGIAQSTVTDGQSVTISMAGKSYTTSGLTAGELYYAAGNGDPSTTAGRTGTMGSPFAVATSTTELLIMRQVFGDEA